MPLRKPPPASPPLKTDSSTAPPPRISLTSWLAIGGIGPPPAMAGFIRMASERKAAHRIAQAYKAAREAAAAEFEEKWPATGKRPHRQELLRLYGPGGTERKRKDEVAGDKGTRR
ncbi:hypothetical protein F4808DRAFT_456725 [Astrocystis sublimbata]|nr:hypothetical protein F4808DRAFT_456725 [Astrocystis sublimbata]